MCIRDRHGCAYGATKAGLTSFSHSLFEEARKYGVRVVNLEPDMTDTNPVSYTHLLSQMSWLLLICLHLQHMMNGVRAV